MEIILQITYLTQELEVRTAALDAERECVLTLREQLRKASDNTGHGIGLITSFYIQIGVTADVQRSSKLQEAQQEIKEVGFPSSNESTTTATTYNISS